MTKGVGYTKSKLVITCHPHISEQTVFLEKYLNEVFSSWKVT